jgi:hypothetical protein
VIEEALPLVARARDSLKLISIACSSTDQPAPVREVAYRSSEADELSKYLIDGVKALPPGANLPCIRKSVETMLSSAIINLPGHTYKFFCWPADRTTIYY